MHVYLVRHGETEWSAAMKHTSFTDVPLTAAGRAHAATLRERFADRDFALALVSPMLRARETHELAGLRAPAVVEPDLVEWDYGEYEGLTTPEIRAAGDPEWSVWTHPTPGGETAGQISARADRVIARLLAAEGDAAVFAHGHMLRVLGARWIELDAAFGSRLALGTGAVCCLGFERERRVIVSWNVR